MNTGRPTTEPKGENVRVRISAEMRDELSRIAQQNQESVSEVIRKAIKAYIRRF